MTRSWTASEGWEPREGRGGEKLAQGGSCWRGNNLSRGQLPISKIKGRGLSKGEGNQKKIKPRKKGKKGVFVWGGKTQFSWGFFRLRNSKGLRERWSRRGKKEEKGGPEKRNKKT